MISQKIEIAFACDDSNLKHWNACYERQSFALVVSRSLGMINVTQEPPMAKKANKSQATRDALKANPSKSPSEIAEMLKANDLKVDAPYVSVVKSAAKAKQGLHSRRAARATTRGKARATD